MSGINNKLGNTWCCLSWSKSDVKCCNNKSFIHFYAFWQTLLKIGYIFISPQGLFNLNVMMVDDCKASWWMIHRPNPDANCFDNQSIVQVSSQDEKCPTLAGSSFLKSLLFWTVGRTKEAVWRHHFGLWEIVTSVFHFFFLVLQTKQIISCENKNQVWIDNENNC